MISLLPSTKRGMLMAFLACFLPLAAIHAQTLIPSQLHNHQPIGGFSQHEKCATMYADSVLRSKVPGSPSLMDFEIWLQGEIAKQQLLPQNKSGNRAIITIPIIVHVVHNGDAVGSNENISAAQVYSQIDVLNEDFRRKNADTTNTPTGFRPVAADIEIEFCPALRDPNGNNLAEPGINRVQRTEATWGNTNTIDGTLKPATIWDPNRYFNIWVVNFGSGSSLLGYAQFPQGSGLAGMPTGTQSANTDGVVVRYNAFGRTGNVTSPYNRGRTTTHEVGHWLGLRHIWGDGGCSVDDYCADTPNSDAANTGCPTTHVSCGSVDMVQNYMDYTNDACMNIFTLNQKTRMTTVMAVSPRRVNLLTSNVCTPLNVAPVAAFTGSPLTVCPGGTVSFTDQSTGNPTSWQWTFQGGTPATSTQRNPTVTYNTLGTYTVTLTATNAYGTNTITRTAYVTVTTPQTNFTSNVTQGCGTLNVQFTNQSTCGTAWQWSFPGGTPSTSTAQNPSVTYSTPGTYNVSLTVNGITNTKPNYITVGSNVTLLNETFESNSFATNGWTVDNPDNGITWVINTVAGNPPGDKAAGINLYNYNSNGQRDRLVSPVLNLSNLSNTQLTFKHAHRRRTQNQRDSLIVYVSTNGGTTWGNRILAVGENGSGSFATNSTTNGPEFIPAATADWCGQGSVGASCFTINLGAFDGQPNVRIRFESFNNIGNNIYLDDIVVTGCQLVPTNPPAAAFSGSPASGCGSLTVQYTDQSTGNPTGWQWAFPGGTPSTSTDQNPSVTYSTPGTYSATLIVLNSAGRDTLARANYITVNASPTVTVSGSNPLCAGQANGSATTSVSGGTGPYTYAWSNNRTTASNSGLTAGTYTVTVTDANGCTATGSTTLTTPLAITATASTTPAYCGGNTGTATLAITGGTAPFTVTWGNGGSGTSIGGLAAGNYGYTVTDDNGCTRTGTATVAANNSGPVLTFNITNVSCNGGSNGAITANVTGGTGPYTYAWGNGGQTNTINSLGSGNYSITVTDANGCSASTSVFVSQPAAISIGTTTVPATCGNSNGSATATVTGGTSPYTYSWSGGGNAATINNRASGTYTVTVTDSRGCTATASVNISNTGGPSVTVNKQDVSCNGGTNGSATATVTGGTAPYIYAWSGGGNTATASNRAAGTHTVTVTDANGCASIASITINQPAAIAITLSATSSSCAASNGSISSTVTGGTAPYSYLWSNSRTTANNTGLAAGAYTVTVTDSRGCTGTALATVTQLAAPVLSIAKTDASCFGTSNGQATVSVTGGSAPYSYTWSHGASGASLSNLAAGNYTVTLVDANNCSATGSVSIGQPSRIVVGNTVDDASCGNNDGSITTAVSGGAPGYSYLWSSGQISSDLFNLASGAYELTVTDQNGCYADTVIVVSNVGGPSATLTSANNTCSGQNNGELTVSASGGTAPYTYIWSNGATGITTISNLSSGIYSVTVTDANGCIAVRTANVSQPSPLQIQTYHVDASCGIHNGQAGILAAGGTAPYTYAWNTGGNQPQLYNLAQGTYAVTVTDANGCQAQTNITIDSLAVLNVVALVDDESCAGQADGAVGINIISGIAPYGFAWSNGFASQNASNLTAGTYHITITDASGCVNVQQVVVNAATPLTVNASVLAIVCGSKFGETEVAVSGGIAPYGYVWSTGDTGPHLYIVSDGNYSVTVTDANGCQQGTSVYVPRSSGPALSHFTTPDTLGTGNGTATVVPLNGIGPFTYLWSNGQTMPTATGLAAGSYAVTVTDGNGCDAVDTALVSLYTGLGEILGEANVSLYPNPTNGKFVLGFKGLVGKVGIGVYDAVGKMVLSQENDILATPSVEVDMSGFAEGVYMVRITQAGQALHYRVVLTD